MHRNFLTDPCWEASDRGKALPDSPHAVSVCLPQWQDVIEYEEKNQECIESLETIYPRFGLNPLVAELSKKALLEEEKAQWQSWPFENELIVNKAKKYCIENCSGNTKIRQISGIFYLLTDKNSSPHAKAFWQHTGLGISSRRAAIELKKELSPSIEEGKIAKDILKKRIAGIYQTRCDHIELYPSGMASLYTALDAVRKFNPTKPFLQIGFPYVDVLKLPRNVFGGCELVIDTDLKELEMIFINQKPAAVIIELPSNPMLQCIDLPSLSKLTKAYKIPLIADDTIGSALNIDPMPYVDLIFSSLTKSFAGRGDILAGSLVVNEKSFWRNIFLDCINANHFSVLSDSDAVALEMASRDVSKRLPLLNKSCLDLKRRLENHPKIIRVFHPENCENFNRLLKTNGGYGCLLSFEIDGGMSEAKKFYDSLQVCKGPSLGTNFTLVCPYVMLAHYEELDWAENCGVPRHLIRVSVGLENTKLLWDKFNKALN